MLAANALGLKSKPVTSRGSLASELARFDVSRFIPAIGIVPPLPLEKTMNDCTSMLWEMCCCPTCTMAGTFSTATTIRRGAVAETTCWSVAVASIR